MYWIRANETQGLGPEFHKMNYENEDDNSMDEKLENNHVDGIFSKKEKEVSEDPFNLYSLLKRQNKLDDKDTNSEDSLKHPPGVSGVNGKEYDDYWCGMLLKREKTNKLYGDSSLRSVDKLERGKFCEAVRHPRGGLELTQVEELAKVINPVGLTQSPDLWSWTLNNSGGYTVASSRNMIDHVLLPKGDQILGGFYMFPKQSEHRRLGGNDDSLVGGGAWPTIFNISIRV
ncbi:hypothetical protein Tco_0714128 [Tanacetum coccineum]